MNLLGDLNLVNSIQDFAASTELSGASAVAVTEINGITYLFVAGQYDAGIQVLRLVNDVLEVVTMISDTTPPRFPARMRWRW